MALKMEKRWAYWGRIKKHYPYKKIVYYLALSTSRIWKISWNEDAEIKDILRKHAVVEVAPVKVQFVSTIFLRPIKKGIRSIIKFEEPKPIFFLSQIANGKLEQSKY